MGDEQNQGKGLRTYLQGIPDPRRRQGRIYPLVSILMMLILAAVNGERSLRGMLVVLDVTYQEDRNHARKVGWPLHAIRCVAINIIRQQGFCYVPDGHRAASARPDRGLAWLGIC
jgi:hypothetical protein